MSLFERIHAALFDELERQGLFAADMGGLTWAVLTAAQESPPQEPYRRCANGACDE
jgi:hypothetical protein